MRRFTRLTSARSRKGSKTTPQPWHSVTYYKFSRVHQTLRVTPAMEAGIADHAWAIEEIITLIG